MFSQIPLVLFCLLNTVGKSQDLSGWCDDNLSQKIVLTKITDYNYLINSWNLCWTDLFSCSSNSSPLLLVMRNPNLNRLRASMSRFVLLLIMPSVHNKPMLWMRRGRKHGNVHGDWLNLVCMSARPDAFGLWTRGPGFDAHCLFIPS